MSSYILSFFKNEIAFFNNMNKKNLLNIRVHSKSPKGLHDGDILFLLRHI